MVTKKKSTGSKKPVAKKASKSSPTASRAKKSAANKRAAAPKKDKKSPAKKGPVTKKSPVAKKKAAPVKTKAKKSAVKKATVKKTTTVKKAAPKAKAKTTPVKKKTTAKAVTTAKKKTETPVKTAPAKAKTAQKNDSPAAKPTPALREKTPAVKATKKATSAVKPKFVYRPEPSILDIPQENSGPRKRYSDNDLQEFKDLIQRKLEAARKELVYLQGLITRKDEAGTDDTENKYMGVEDGSGTMEREQLSQLASRQIQYIDHLEKALVRIENKTYGICRVTGKLIDKARLRAVPHATLSIEAKLANKK
jgi:RNA polymerase-binding transcription factor DksA